MICLHNGKLHNGLYLSESLSAVLFDEEKIIDVFSEERFNAKHFPPDTIIIDCKENYILPGFIDTHIHGFKGHGTDNCTTEGMLKMSKDLAAYGVTAFNPTLYPAPLETMKANLKAIVAAMGKEQGAHIMGIHLEGPFISPEKLGVQLPEYVQKPDIGVLNELWEASEGHIINMTVAPELTGMRELAMEAMHKGIVLQSGHTNAQYRNMLEGFQVGILHSTHFFNAMSEMHHRNPGAVGAILSHPEVSCEIIADGVHIHHGLFRIIKRDKHTDKIVLITDALTPTEQKKGPFYANGEEVEFVDGCFHRKSDGVIAGSALTLKKAVENIVNFRYSFEDAIKFVTSNPARIMKFEKKGRIIPMADSDIIVMDKNYKIKFVAIGGKIRKNNLEKK